MERGSHHYLHLHSTRLDHLSAFVSYYASQTQLFRWRAHLMPAKNKVECLREFFFNQITDVRRTSSDSFLLDAVTSNLMTWIMLGWANGVRNVATHPTLTILFHHLLPLPSHCWQFSVCLSTQARTHNVSNNLNGKSNEWKIENEQNMRCLPEFPFLRVREIEKVNGRERERNWWKAQIVEHLSDRRRAPTSNSNDVHQQQITDLIPFPWPMLLLRRQHPLTVCIVYWHATENTSLFHATNAHYVLRCYDNSVFLFYLLPKTAIRLVSRCKLCIEKDSSVNTSSNNNVWVGRCVSLLNWQDEWNRKLPKFETFYRQMFNTYSHFRSDGRCVDLSSSFFAIETFYARPSPRDAGIGKKGRKFPIKCARVAKMT